MKIHTIVASLAIFASQVSETVLMESTIAQGGLLCDSEEQTKLIIKLLEENKTFSEAVNSVEGCGVLMVPARMRVVAIGVHETDTYKYLLVRYEFLDLRVPPQFGIGSRVESRGT